MSSSCSCTCFQQAPSTVTLAQSLDANVCANPFAPSPPPCPLLLTFIMSLPHVQGDGNIRVYDMSSSDAAPDYIMEHKSNVAMSGLALLPKQEMDVSKTEIDRMIKLSTSAIDVITWTLPRSTPGYDAEAHPDTWDGQPLYTAEEWYGGAQGKERNMVSLEPKE